VKPAVLIANGPSAEGYQPPDDAFVVCLNDGFKRHRCDAVMSVDCPPDLKDAWVAWRGIKVMSDRNAAYPAARDERGRRIKEDIRLFPCDHIMRKYRSSTACALAWLTAEGYRRVTMVGVDALFGGGKAGALYTRGNVLPAPGSFCPGGYYRDPAGRCPQARPRYVRHSPAAGRV